MPNLDDLEKLGSIAFLLGEKPLPTNIDTEDYDRYKSIFTDEILNAAKYEPPKNDIPSLDSLDGTNDIDLDENTNDDVVKDISTEDDLSINGSDLDDLIDDTENTNEDESLNENNEPTEESSPTETDDLDLDDLIDDTENTNEDESLNEDNEPTEESSPTETDDLDLDDLDLNNLDLNNLDLNNLDLDNLDLDDLIDDTENTNEDESLNEDNEPTEESSPTETDDLDLNNLDLDDLIDDTENTNEDESLNENNEPTEESSPTETDDLDLDDLIDDTENTNEDESFNEDNEPTEESSPTETDDLDLDDLIDDTENTNEDESLNEDNEPTEESSPTETDDNKKDKDHGLLNPNSYLNLPPSKYGNLSDDLDLDTIVENINNLNPILQNHVLDTIFNEKLEKNDMAKLLKALLNNNDEDEILFILRKKLGIKINKHSKRKITDLIPIPQRFKEYASIIRVACLASFTLLLVGILSYQFIYKPVMSNSYFSRGVKELNQGNYGYAENNFAKGDKLKPKQTQWYNKYARGYINRELFLEARDKIDYAMKTKPLDFESQITLGYYHRKKGEKELSVEEYTQGEVLYDNMLIRQNKEKKLKTVLDEKGLLMISRALTLFEDNYLEMAYSNYSTLAQTVPNSILARKMGMLIRIYQDQYDKVLALEKRIATMKKGYFDDLVYPELAKYYLSKEKFYEARTLFEKILAKYPKNLNALLGYADYFFILNNYDSTKNILINHVMPLYEANPFLKGREMIHNMLGQIYYNTKEYAMATLEFKNALDINQAYPDANYNLGNIYFYQDNNYEKAKEHYQIAYASLPKELRSTQLIYNLSWLYYSDEEYDNAFEGFYSLFEKEKDETVVSYALGNSLLHLERENLANGFYRKALNIALDTRNKLGTLKMRTDKEFILISYLASLYNNIGVSYAYKYAKSNNVEDQQAAFNSFVVASEYFDQLRTSQLNIQASLNKTIILDNQNVGIAKYNLMAIQTERNLKEVTAIDNFIPKDMYQVPSYN